MRLRFLTNSTQRALGAMFARDLQEDLLVFVYPHPARRTFHTFFCPRLRMVALGPAGEVLFDRVIDPGRLVRLPACQYVLEVDPHTDYGAYMETILYRPRRSPRLGAMQPEASLDRLLFALLAEAVADMRRVRRVQRGTVCSEVQRQNFAVWERGQMVSSAGFLLDFTRAWSLPEGAVQLSRQVLRAERSYLDELVAASVAGVPWRQEFPKACMRCGRAGSWRPVLQAPQGAAMESSWRYERPENAVPLCHRCADTLGFVHDPSIRLDLARGLWGLRFEALWRWHRVLRSATPIEWDLYAFPLWPQDYGGDTWEKGSGALAFAEPRPPHGLARSRRHLNMLKRALYSKPFRGSGPGEVPLQRLLEFQFDTPGRGES